MRCWRQASRWRPSYTSPPLHWSTQAPVAQGIERCPAEAEVASSNLAGRTRGTWPGSSRPAEPASAALARLSARGSPGLCSRTIPSGRARSATRQEPRALGLAADRLPAAGRLPPGGSPAPARLADGSRRRAQLRRPRMPGTARSLHGRISLAAPAVVDGQVRPPRHNERLTETVRARLRRGATLFLALIAFAIACPGQRPGRSQARLHGAGRPHGLLLVGDGRPVRGRVHRDARLLPRPGRRDEERAPNLQSRFSADGSLWLWEYAKNKDAGRLPAARRRAEVGHISAPLNPLVVTYGGVPAEAVIRSMYYPGQLERRYGVDFPLAIAMENAGMSARPRRGVGRSRR